MHRPHLSIAVTGLGVLLLVDVLRVWLPSIITIFGQAAATPAELLGGFALLWFLLALGAPPLARLAGVRPVGLVAAVALAACRVALAGTPGGAAQLYVASIGLLAGLVWLAATAMAGHPAVPGVVVGLAAATVAHTALDTHDLTWRDTTWSRLLILAAALTFAVLATRPGPQPRREDPAGWLLFGPALLLSGMLAGSPAAVTTAVSYLAGRGPAIAEPPPLGDLAPALVVGAAVALFVAAGLADPPISRRWTAPGLLLVGTAVFATGAPTGLLPAILLTAAGLGGCLGQASARTSAAPPSPTRPGYAAVAGMLLFAVPAVIHYAAYDIGYPNQWVPVTVAGFIAAVALRRDATVAPATRHRDHRAAVAAGVAGALATVAGLATPMHLGPSDGDTSGPIRLVAYNIRMGYGLDGRFDLDGLVDVIAGQRPDVVTLSEVDRAWLLNGGHDTLALLADRLDLPYVFAPAADPFWGDAVLARAPVLDARTVRLSAHGAPTGAQALAVVLDVSGRELVVVSTHLQPPPGGEPVAQAREVVRFATDVAAGRPMVVAGDMNTEPGAPAFQVFTEAGLADALAAVRPLPTSPADTPTEQIDHVFVSAGIRASEPAAPHSTASDHLPVAVTLALP